MKRHLFSLTTSEIIFFLTKLKYQNPVATAEHVIKMLYKSANITFNLLHINSKLKKDLSTDFITSSPLSLAHISTSLSDNTIKFLFKTQDNYYIESVLVPEKNRLTQCISSQIGCKMKCTFCITGKRKFIRNLRTEEIIYQVLLANYIRNKLLACYLLSNKYYKQISNIVYMGMGEPLDNLSAILQSEKIFCECKGLNVSYNKITISTVGIVDNLDFLLTHSKAGVAISLHSPFNIERSAIMPINRQYSIESILQTLKKYPHKVFFIQYILLKNKNDTLRHATELYHLLKDIKVKINIIPLNESPMINDKRPDLEHIYKFQNWLKSFGLFASIRFSKGTDIQAACGHLVNHID